MKVTTATRLPRDGGGVATFRGEYSAFRQLESLDMSVIGRDVLQFFAVIVDRPDDVVALIRKPHRYAIESS